MPAHTTNSLQVVLIERHQGKETPPLNRNHSSKFKVLPCCASEDFIWDTGKVLLREADAANVARGISCSKRRRNKPFTNP